MECYIAALGNTHTHTLGSDLYCQILSPMLSALVLPLALTLRPWHVPFTGRGAARSNAVVASVAETERGGAAGELRDAAQASIKEKLVNSLLYNKPLTEEGKALFDELAEKPPPVPGDVVWWLGRYQMRSSHHLAEALKAAGGWRLLDGAPVLVKVTGEKGDALELEADLLVVGCDTGLRLTGSLQHGLLPGDDAGLLRATLDAAEFFEPSDEFGISKALTKCEAELRPNLPSDSNKMSLTLRPVFVDEDVTLLKETGKLPEGREDPVLIVLSRLPPEDGDNLIAGLETEDDYS